MKRKKSPPSLDLIRSLNVPPHLDLEGAKRYVASVVSQIRYAGDVKQIAERFGLHYLKSKRMRTRELRQWILDNHPDLKEIRQRKDIPGISPLMAKPEVIP